MHPINPPPSLLLLPTVITVRSPCLYKRGVTLTPIRRARGDEAFIQGKNINDFSSFQKMFRTRFLVPLMNCSLICLAVLLARRHAFRARRASLYLMRVEFRSTSASDPFKPSHQPQHLPIVFVASLCPDERLVVGRAVIQRHVLPRSNQEIQSKMMKTRFNQPDLSY